MAIKVGILGFAHGHVMSYGGQWKAHPELEIEMVAAWDHDAGRLENCTAQLGIPKKCATPEELLAEDIDAVVISSETSRHCEFTEMAAAAGKAIICYKPMALTLAEADRMVAAVEKYNVPFTMGYQSRVDPQNIKIKELIQSEEIGPTYLYRRRHGLSTHNWAGFENTWHNSPEHNRDIFADDSAHPIDMLNWIFGVPETVSAEMSTMHNPKVPNDNGVALFKYANGMIAEITCCFTCSAAEITTEVYGSKGAITQYYGDAVSTRLPRPSDQPGLKWFVEGNSTWTDSEIPSPGAHGERLAAQAWAFADFLHGRREPICSVYSGRDSLRMVLACYLSAREGCRVRIDDERVYEI